MTARLASFIADTFPRYSSWLPNRSVERPWKTTYGKSLRQSGKCVDARFGPRRGPPRLPRRRFECCPKGAPGHGAL